MPPYMAFHLSLHCLPVSRIKRSNESVNILYIGVTKPMANLNSADQVQATPRKHCDQGLNRSFFVYMGESSKNLKS